MKRIRTLRINSCIVEKDLENNQEGTAKRQKRDAESLGNLMFSAWNMSRCEKGTVFFSLEIEDKGLRIEANDNQFVTAMAVTLWE